MAYTKPGVSVEQVNNNTTPILQAPNLTACMIGRSYWWQDPALDESTYSTKYTDAGGLTIALSGINSSYNELTSVSGLTTVDLIITKGNGTSNTIHVPIANITRSGLNHLVIDAGLLVSNGGEATGEADAKVGYLATNSGSQGFNTHASVADIRDVLGPIVSWNPLAFGVYLAMSNSGSEIQSYGVSADSPTAVGGYSDAYDALETKESYALVPLTEKDLAVGTISTHCNTMSAAAGKKERIAFVAPQVLWDPLGTAHAETSSQKLVTAGLVGDANSAYESKRIFSVHPDAGYLQETRHISTIHPDWIASSFSLFTNVSFSIYELYAKFAADVRINSVLYKKGSKITSTIWSALVAAEWGTAGMVTVLVPVPGFYYGAEAAGLVAGESPEQPLTRLPISIMKQTYGSQDYFSEAQLNRMAQGGTYIMTQNSDFSSVYCRHHSSTNVTSVAKRELSVTKAVDYTSKFIRDGLDPYIGRNTISPSFLKFVNSVLVSIGLFLTRKNYIDDLQVVSIVQNSVNADTIDVEINLLPLYPANYITIKLVF